jgi:hypothetical protein
MWDYVLHNGQAGGNLGCGRDQAIRMRYRLDRAITIELYTAWVERTRARRAERRSDAAAAAVAGAVAAADAAVGAAPQGTTGDDPDRLVRDVQQQIYTGIEGAPGPADTTVHSPAENDHTQPMQFGSGGCLTAATWPRCSGDIWLEEQYSRCTWARCSGDCRCGVTGDSSERTAPSDPADCCVVSDAFESCTWETCYDECTCRPSSRSQVPLAVTTGTPAPVARNF